MFFTFFTASSLLSELKAFSSSIRSMASVSGLSNSLLKLLIAYSIPHFWPKQSWKIFPKICKVSFYTLIDCFANYSSQNFTYTNGPYTWIFVRRYQVIRVVCR